MDHGCPLLGSTHGAMLRSTFKSIILPHASTLTCQIICSGVWFLREYIYIYNTIYIYCISADPGLSKAGAAPGTCFSRLLPTLFGPPFGAILRLPGHPRYGTCFSHLLPTYSGPLALLRLPGHRPRCAIQKSASILLGFQTAVWKP